jgi:hypothetical protein
MWPADLVSYDLLNRLHCPRLQSGGHVRRRSQRLARKIRPLINAWYGDAKSLRGIESCFTPSGNICRSDDRFYNICYRLETVKTQIIDFSWKLPFRLTTAHFGHLSWISWRAVVLREAWRPHPAEPLHRSLSHGCFSRRPYPHRRQSHST